jgi:hypothetical protein
MQLLRKIWQKLTRGFADEEVYDLDETIAKFLAPRLLRLAELNNRQLPEPMGWRGILTKMADAFGQYQELGESVEGRQYFDEAMDLFSFFFEELWTCR